MICAQSLRSPPTANYNLLASNWFSNTGHSIKNEISTIVRGKEGNLTAYTVETIWFKRVELAYPMSFSFTRLLSCSSGDRILFLWQLNCFHRVNISRREGMGLTEGVPPIWVLLMSDLEWWHSASDCESLTNGWLPCEVILNSGLSFYYTLSLVLIFMGRFSLRYST